MKEFEVRCLCAAWCDTCAAYRDGFLALALRFPQAQFLWVDIEEDPDAPDVDDFPTIEVRRGERRLFYGVMRPRHEHLRRLLEELVERCS